MIMYWVWDTGFVINHEGNKTLMYKYYIKNELWIITRTPTGQVIEIPWIHKVKDLIDENAIEDNYKNKNSFYQLYN